MFNVFGEPVGIARDPLGRIVVGKEQLNANRDVMKVESFGKDDTRRSIYVQMRRQRPVTVLETFDEIRLIIDDSEREIGACEGLPLSSFAPGIVSFPFHPITYA